MGGLEGGGVANVLLRDGLLATAIVSAFLVFGLPAARIIVPRPIVMLSLGKQRFHVFSLPELQTPTAVQAGDFVEVIPACVSMAWTQIFALTKHALLVGCVEIKECAYFFCGFLDVS